MPLFNVERTDEPDYGECVELLIRADSAERAIEIACMATGVVVTPRRGGDDWVRWDHDYEGMRLANVKASVVTVNGPEEVIAATYSE